MNSSIIIFLLAVVLFLSCARDDTGTKQLPGEVITLEPAAAKTRNFKELFDNIRFLKLATSDSGLVGKVKDIFVSSDLIFISDFQGVFIYNHSGEFLCGIKRKGRAPQEYLAFTSVYIDTINNVLEVLDNRNQKIINYNFNGRFLGERDVPLIPLSFIKNHRDYFFYTGNQYVPEFPYSLVVATLQGKFLPKKEYLPVDRARSKYLHIQFANNFYYYQDTIRFFRPLDDTIYSIVNDELQPRYLVDFGKNKIPAAFYDYPYKDIRDFYRHLFTKGYAYNISAIHETEQFLMLTFYIAGKARQVFYNKQTQQVVLVKSWVVDFLGGKKVPVNYIRPYCIYKNSLYSYLEPYDLVTTLDSIKENSTSEYWNRFSERHKGLSDIYEETKISDNPILVIYNLE